MSEAAFLVAATSPRDRDHREGTLDEANFLLPGLTPSIHTAAVLGDAPAVADFLAHDLTLATRPGGPLACDPLTCLCFSRYLRLEPTRPFPACARLLLDAGASANTGWYETIDTPPRQLLESALYGAAAVTRHFELTKLLLAHGADPNDEETPYHVPESSDNAILELLLNSGRLTPDSLRTLLLRKADHHDEPGIRLVLDHHADPNPLTRWGRNVLHQALLRDNALSTITLLLDRGADPTLPDAHHRTALQIAARRGRADVLSLLPYATLTGPDLILAQCALGQPTPFSASTLPPWLAAHALAEFAGNGNAPGVSALLALGIPVDTPYPGDSYFAVPPQSTALHVAAWRAHPLVVDTLLAAGANPNARDSLGRTPLELAIKAATDSYWTHRRTPESIRSLLAAGASTARIPRPTGYPEADRLLDATTP